MEALLRRALVDGDGAHSHPPLPLPVHAHMHATAQAMLSASDLEVVHVVIICCNSLSIFGCAFILWHFLRSARGPRYATSMSQRMVVMLSLLDLSYSLPKVFPHPDAHTDKLACDAQGFALEFTGLMCTSCTCALDLVVVVLAAAVGPQRSELTQYERR